MKMHLYREHYLCRWIFIGVAGLEGYISQAHTKTFGQEVRMPTVSYLGAQHKIAVGIRSIYADATVVPCGTDESPSYARQIIYGDGSRHLHLFFCMMLHHGGRRHTSMSRGFCLLPMARGPWHRDCLLQ
jgi:hypothetical protein